MLQLPSRPLSFVILACGLAAVLLPAPAEAFTVRLHVYFANAIHDELERNMEADGRPALRLLGPDGGATYEVLLDPQNAQAILDYPEYFRAGAIGPDNIVMPGLTEVSHGWTNDPYRQCRALLTKAEDDERLYADLPHLRITPEAEDGIQRAYALGCFLHGITDNTAHHLVNYFAEETFTLYPTEVAEPDALSFSLLNMVRHIVVETLFEEAFMTHEANLTPADRDRPGVLREPLTEAHFEHTIARDLTDWVYFTHAFAPTNLWPRFGENIVSRKTEWLNASFGQAPDANPLDALREAEDPWAADRQFLQAWADYLSNADLEPPEYILILPELFQDLHFLLTLMNEQGMREAQEFHLNLFVGDALEAAFAPRNEEDEPDWNAVGESRFETEVLASKRVEINELMLRFIESIENLSNINLKQGLIHADRAQLRQALNPLTDALERIVDIDYARLFDSSILDFFAEIELIQEILAEIVTMLRERLEAWVVETMLDFLGGFIEEYQRLLDSVTDELRRRIIAGFGFPTAGPFGDFLDSVLFAVGYNSVAAVLSHPEGVLGFDNQLLAGPESFDASYQLEFNQFALCPELRAAVYPCGVSAGEMMEPDFRRCVPLGPGEARMDPPVECRDGALDMFSSMPSPRACEPRPLAEFLENGADTGSYTLSFPPGADTGTSDVARCRTGIEMTPVEQLAPPVTPPVTPGVTPPVTPPVTPGVTPDGPGDPGGNGNGGNGNGGNGNGGNGNGNGNGSGNGSGGGGGCAQAASSTLPLLGCLWLLLGLGVRRRASRNQPR